MADGERISAAPATVPASPAALTAEITRLHKELPLSSRLAGGLHHGMLSAIAALIAYVPAELIGLKESFWGAITAIAVVQTEFHATQTTARDQCIGAAIGGIVGLCMLLVFGGNLAIYAGTVMLAMTICWAFNVASASRLSGTTATIIMLVPHTGPPLLVLVSRVSEVAWGVCVAVGVVWLGARLPRRGGSVSE